MGRTAFIICLLCVFAFFAPEEIKAADMYSDAYIYYNTVGNAMCFTPGADGRGEIYYATKAKSAVGNSILYTTLGWKVNVYNSSHTLAESVYYQLGGPNMQKVHQSLVAGYEYNLYKVSLDNIKSRLGYVAYTVLGMPNSYMTFDACTTTKINGVVQGGMTDSGYTWGNVYTTYEGIAGAQNWSQETMQTLYSYYNKSVSGLSHSVYASGSEGIKSIFGIGSYCYGMIVSLQASVEDGYEFAYWTDGYNISESPIIGFPMSTVDMYFYAAARPMGVTVHFYDNIIATARETQKYGYDVENQSLPDFGWMREGYHQVNWNEKADGSGQAYDIKCGITNDWINKYRPETNLYAVWDMNSYHIVYDTNGGRGEIIENNALYSDEIILSEGGYTRESATLVGWSRDKEALAPEFKLGQKIVISDIVKSLGLEYTNAAEITLYAVWDLAPEIIGEEIYVEIEDAKAGVLTEEFLSKYVVAEDREDGIIPYGRHESNSFLFTDYCGEDLKKVEHEQIIILNLQAVDCVGNSTEKKIKVYIVEMSAWDDKWILGTPRFISHGYYKNLQGEFIEEKKGGLQENSIWREKSEYSQLLDEVFGIR